VLHLHCLEIILSPPYIYSRQTTAYQLRWRPGFSCR